MRKNSYLYFLTGILCLVILIIPSFRDKAKNVVLNGGRIVFSPISLVGQKGGGFFSGLSHIKLLREQNELLSNQLTSLEVDRSQINELKHENELLKEELGFVDAAKNEEFIPARIIGRDPTTFLDYILIDRGQDDGVEANAAVLSEGVLVGQVNEVTKHTAKIVLITAKNSIVQAMLQNSRSKGVLHGGISGLVLRNISQDVEFSKDEYVITSGLGGELREGILIGRVVSLQSSTSDIFKSIAVEPIVDLSDLEMVFIMKRSAT